MSEPRRPVLTISPDLLEHLDAMTIAIDSGKSDMLLFTGRRDWAPGPTQQVIATFSLPAPRKDKS